LGNEASWAGDYRYTLGETLLVAPILDATGKRDVALPAGSRYYDFWSPAADPIEGGTTISVDHSTDLTKVPLYFRAGAILPMHVADDVTGFGTAASSGKLTVVVFPDTTPSSFSLHDTDEAITKIDASLPANRVAVTISRTLVETIVRIRAEQTPTGVLVNSGLIIEHPDRGAFDMASSGAFYDAATRSIWVKLPAQTTESAIELLLP
jgi:alpha-D-xyloside xylohydrolase